MVMAKAADAKVIVISMVGRRVDGVTCPPGAAPACGMFRSCPVGAQDGGDAFQVVDRDLVAAQRKEHEEGVQEGEGRQA